MSENTLETRLARGPLPPEEVATVIADVIAAVAATHGEGRLERTLDLSRIVVEDGRARLIEGKPALGAKRGDAAPDDRAFDVTLRRFTFLSPEQVRGSRHVDARSDIYAVGALAFLLTTGKRPFDSVNALTAVALKLDRAAPTLEEVTGRPFPPLLESFVATALARDRDRRYPTIGVAREAWQLAVAVG